MDESPWPANSVSISSLGNNKTSGENILYPDICTEVVQYDGENEPKRIRLESLSGVFARTGPNKMNFYLDWPSCISIITSADKAGMKLILGQRVIWMEVNQAIDSVIKNSH